MTKTGRAWTWLVVALVWVVLLGVFALISTGRMPGSKSPAKADGKDKDGRDYVVVKTYDILFERGTDRVSQRSYDDLDEVVRLLAENPGYRVTAIGCSGGDTEGDRQLAHNRATRLRSELERKGMASDRLENGQIELGAYGAGAKLVIKQRKTR